jgi:8-oxo-dGTP diphosphatase
VPIRRHLTAVLPGGAFVTEIEALRRRWDPVMAAAVPAHVSVVYPEETVDEAVLLDRMRRESARLRAFPLDARGVERAEEGRGVFLGATDRTGALTALRQRLLAPNPASVLPLHVTIVHPRTSEQGPQAFAALESNRVAGSMVVSELAFTETTPEGMTVLERFELAPGRIQVVGAVLRRGDRILLGHRCAGRASFPDVWDLPGGHVEPGEHAAGALARELREELAIEVDPPPAPTKVFSDDALGVDLSVWFVDRWIGEPVNAAPEEHDALAWGRVEDWSRLPLADPRYPELLAAAVDSA